MRRLILLLAFNLAVLAATGLLLLRAHATLDQVKGVLAELPAVRALPGLPGLYVQDACVISHFNDGHVYVDCPGNAELQLNVVDDDGQDQRRS